ncbi:MULTISPECIES: WYL domain-containing protein [Clostridia]|uniref:WYL domain-containing protein n=1 Tax=Clostridia TaxID=186801 RepID=UPI002101221D|nr:MULTISPECIES: WYL domain-containing protein [Clostridia]
MERVYRKNKKRYEVDPMALIFNNNNYYLMCFSSKYVAITNYRLDRMKGVDVIDDPVHENALIHSSDVPSFTSQAFSMYGGPVENAVLQVSNKLIGVIYDQFGEQTQMIRQDDNSCIATAQIQKSPTFWGWLFTFGNDMKILAPETLIKDWQEQVKNLL